MNKKAIFLNLFSVITITFAAAEQPKTEFEKFAEKFAPPAGVQKTIESAPEWPYFGHIAGNEGFPNIYAKNNTEIERICNAYIMDRIIDKLQLNNLNVPKKYLSKSEEGYWGIAAEFVEKDISPTADHYSYEEVKQLIKLQEELCYRDFTYGNIRRNKKTGKVTFIDTENISFYTFGNGQTKFSKKNCVRLLNNFLHHAHGCEIDNKSKILLRDRIQKLAQSEDGTKKRDFLQEAHQKYNDTGIDFEKAEEEYWKRILED